MERIQVTPVTALLPSGVAAIAIAAGIDHTCVIVAGGGAKCWGGNDIGQLGIGSTAQQNSPADVSLGAGIKMCVGRRGRLEPAKVSFTMR